ncbi:stage III sporulation protein AA [Gordoniibacillus kamchatkensis]|uniref:stage III sporulation protein AA n=1 Tax=Gordoniibacillus kamchatkensis TaxID=1590651 RepID=UPI0009E5874D|nr:stage III sporulation protein AA [Paenibacillus sp. VKM B-2647]
MPEAILSYMPDSLQRILRPVWPALAEQLEEIRVRENRPLELRLSGGSRFVAPGGVLTGRPNEAYMPTRSDCAAVLELLTNHSAYSYEEELRLGYITIPGGHRVGLAGRAVLEGGRVRLQRDVGSYNFRIARQVVGVAKPFVPSLLDIGAATLHHTLIVSPPQHGKTTFARDLARIVSAGEWPPGAWGNGPAASRPGLKVGVVDERSELAACVQGAPRFDLGPRTDVLDGCPKAEGMMMLIRSMSPEVLVADELGRPEDAAAVREAIHAGIRVAATAHGNDLDDVRRRPALRELLGEGAFRRIVTLRRKPGEPLQGAVWDEQGRRLFATSGWAGGLSAGAGYRPAAATAQNGDERKGASAR